MGFFKKHTVPEIEIKLPEDWNRLTVSQLEDVSRIMIAHAKRYSSTGRYSQALLFTEVFFALSGLEVIVKGVDNKGFEYYDCQFADADKRNSLQNIDGAIRPIRIKAEDIVILTCLMSDYVDKKDKPVIPKGGLNWLLRPSNIVAFPYPEISIVDKSTTRKNRKTVEFRGPLYLAQDFSWRQYRNATEFMSYLARVENRLVAMTKNVDKYGEESVRKMDARVRHARAQFLATLFSRKIWHIDRETGQKVFDFQYVTSQSSENERFFMDFPEEKFQCVSLWWQGLMQYLSRKYPKVFKKESVGSADEDPLSVYTRSTTTMIKYTSSNEEQVNNTTYTIILQHINDMAEENERIEKIKNNK